MERPFVIYHNESHGFVRWISDNQVVGTADLNSCSRFSSIVAATNYLIKHKQNVANYAILRVM